LRQLRLRNWQIVAHGDLSFDLTLVVATSLTAEDRQGMGTRPDQPVHRGARRGRGPRLTFDRWYRTYLFMVLVWWTPTAKSDVDFDFHDLDGTIELIRRITTAIDDLDAFG
jgi:hypothetical protein